MRQRVLGKEPQIKSRNSSDEAEIRDLRTISGWLQRRPAPGTFKTERNTAVFPGINYPGGVDDLKIYDRASFHRSPIDSVSVNVTSDYIPEWPPNWTNAPDNGFRSHSSPDSVLVQTDDVLRCAVSTAATTFVSVFSPIFMVFFWIVCWYGIVEPRERIAFMTFGTFCGISTFGIIYAIMRHHRNRGDYVVVDHSNRRVILPRHNRTFCLDDIQCLQMLTGRDKNDEVVNNSDLNLLVDEDGVIVRYHLMGNPLKEHARIISQAMNTKLYEQNVPPGWFRSSDRQSPLGETING